MTSEEVKALIVALGTALLDDFDLDKLRYHKIIIMTDADSDGAHIRTLLLTLFYRYFKPIIEQGYLYIAQPPLYKIQIGKKVEYAYSEAEKDQIVNSLLEAKLSKKQSSKEEAKKLKIITQDKGETVLGVEKEEGEKQDDQKEVSEEKSLKGIDLQRYKGLGEMNPSELWETTMNPEKRILKKVSINDAEEADRLFDILMGGEVLPRKKFIQAYAQQVKNLDI